MSDSTLYFRLPPSFSGRGLAVVPDAIGDDAFAAHQIEFVRQVFARSSHLRAHSSAAALSDAFLAAIVGLFEALDENSPRDARRCAWKVQGILAAIYPELKSDQGRAGSVLAASLSGNAEEASEPYVDGDLQTECEDVDSTVLQAACRPWTQRNVKADALAPRVLIADDNVGSAQALAAYLELEEFDCRIAFGGMEAVRIGREWRPHLVVMDISMPHCNGFQAAMALRESEGTSGIAIIVYTSLDEAEVRRHLNDHEFDGYCQKGQRPRHLVDLITRLAH